MRVTGEPDFSVKFLDKLENVLDDLLGPFLVRVCEGACNEIDLHIDDD